MIEADPSRPSRSRFERFKSWIERFDALRVGNVNAALYLSSDLQRPPTADELRAAEMILATKTADVAVTIWNYFVGVGVVKG